MTQAAQALVDAARRRQPAYLLSAVDRPYAEKICRTAKDDPGMLERAALLMQLFSPAEICGLLDGDPVLDRVKGVGDGLAALLEACWQDLPKERRQALERLSVFEGAFERDAAERVAGVGGVQIAVLASHGLLRRAGSSRYALPPDIRSVAVLKREAGGTSAEVRRAHAAYFLSRAAADEGAPTETGEGASLPDLSAAWLESMAGDLELPLRTAGRVYARFLGAGAHEALLDLCERTEGVLQTRPEQAGGEAGARELTAHNLAAQGAALWKLGRHAESDAALLRASEAWRHMGRWREGLAALEEILARQGERAMDGGLEGALEGLLNERRKARDAAGEADALRLLGRFEHSRRRLGPMRSHLGAAAEFFRRAGDRLKLEDCLIYLADGALREGDYKEAKAIGAHFLADAGDHVDKGRLIWSHLRVAEAEELLGEFDQAISRLSRALALVDGAKDRWTHAYFTNKLAEAQRIAGRMEEAQRNSRHALDEFNSLGDAWGSAWSQDFLGYALFLADKEEEGRRELAAAERRFRELQDGNSLMHCLRHRAEAELAGGRVEEALALAREGLAGAEASGYISVLLDHLAMVAAALDTAGRKEQAYKLVGGLLAMPACSQVTRRFLGPRQQALAGALAPVHRAAYEAKAKSLDLKAALALAQL